MTAGSSADRARAADADPVAPGSGATKTFRVIAGIALGIAYVGFAHWLMTAAPPSPWNAVGVLGPMLVAMAAGCWRGGRRLLAGGAAAVLVGLGLHALAGRSLAPEGLYLAHHVGANLALAVAFGSTLRRGRTALITRLARRVHRVFTPALALYTRHCTTAWVVYFVAVAALSVVLYIWAPFDAWALYANVLSPISVGAMFLGEYLVRYRLHPDFERITMADAIRSYRERAAG